MGGTNRKERQEQRKHNWKSARVRVILSGDEEKEKKKEKSAGDKGDWKLERNERLSRAPTVYIVRRVRCFCVLGILS